MVHIEATAIENKRYDDAELVAQPGIVLYMLERVTMIWIKWLAPACGRSLSSVC